MKRLLNLFLAALFAFAPVAQAELRAVSPPSVLLLAQSWVSVATPADATEDVLATITVPANMLGANGTLRIFTYWSATNNVNNKTYRVRYSGGAGAQFLTLTRASSANTSAITLIGTRNNTAVEFGSSHFADAAGSGLVGAGTAAVDTTAATTIVITGQKATSTDALSLEGYVIEVVH